VDLDMFFNVGSSLGAANTIDPFTGMKAYNNTGSSGWGPTFPGNNHLSPIGVVTNGAQQTIGWGNMVGVSSPLGADSIGSQVTTPAMSIGGTFLDDIQVDFLVQATQASQSTRTLIAPRLTLFNGMEANIFVGSQQAYISQMTFVPGQGGVVGGTGGAGGYTPTVAWLSPGAALDVTAVISADRRYVTMQVFPSVQSIVSITNISLGGGSFIQLPNITTETLQTIVTVPDGGTLLLGGQRLSDEIEREGGTPGLDKIPILNRLFSNRGKVRDEKTLLILIRPKIIIPNEEEDKAFPPRN
jgi:type II secretory pathway component GspD/PulD (secretin)